MTTLERLDAARGPFASVMLAAPSRHDDAAHRLEIHWRNAARALLDAGFPEADVTALEELISGIGHDEGEALVVCRAVGGPQLVERLREPIGQDVAVVDDLPRYGPILENRQRSVAHLVVETDRVGAEIIAFDAGGEPTGEVVEGETLHVHRGHPGGWSQRRFQQRAENVWEANAGEVAATVAATAREVHAELIVVTGDVRAVGFLVEHLAEDVRPLVQVIDEGSPTGIADAVVRLVDDVVARTTRAQFDEWRDRRSAGTSCAGIAETLDALAEGRVELLLVHDDPADERRGELRRDGQVISGRLVDVAIKGSRLTGADVRLAPNVGDLTDGMGALLRW